MSAEVLDFPNMTLSRPDRRLDPNLAKHFTADEIRTVLARIQLVAGQQTLCLLQRHNPEIEHSLTQEELGRYVVQIASFFLGRAADLVTTPSSRKAIISEPRP